MKYLIIFFGACLNIFGDILLKQWADGKISIFWGLLVYSLDAFVFAILLNRQESFMMSLVVWEIVVVSFGVLWGHFFLGESLSSMNTIGVLLATVSIFLMET